MKKRSIVQSVRIDPEKRRREEDRDPNRLHLLTAEQHKSKRQNPHQEKKR